MLVKTDNDASTDAQVSPSPDSRRSEGYAPDGRTRLMARSRPSQVSPQRTFGRAGAGP